MSSEDDISRTISEYDLLTQSTCCGWKLVCHKLKSASGCCLDRLVCGDVVCTKGLFNRPFRQGRPRVLQGYLAIRGDYCGRSSLVFILYVHAGPLSRPDLTAGLQFLHVSCFPLISGVDVEIFLLTPGVYDNFVFQ